MQATVTTDLAHGSFEPCVEHRGPAVDGPCDDCGWLVAEHTAGLAGGDRGHPRHHRPSAAASRVLTAQPSAPPKYVWSSSVSE